MAQPSRLDSVIALAKGRGFVFQSGEIYGGSRSAWDYGPLGVELKENIKRQWWQRFVRGRGDMVGLDSAVILPRKVWEASGHVATFTDPLVECLHCHHRFREDHLIEAFVAIQDVMIDKAMTTPSAPTLKLFFVREQGGQEPPIATEIFQQRVRGPLNRVALALVAKICGTTSDDPRTILRLLTLHGQFMSFHTAPRSVMTLLGWSTMDAAKIDLVKQTIFANTRSLLQLWSVERETAAPVRQSRATHGKEKAAASRRKG